MVLRYWEICKQFSIKLTASHRRNNIIRYAFPIVLVLLNTVLSYLSDKILGNTIPLHLITLFIVLSAWYGGLGPGILATFLFQTVNSLLFPLPAVAFTDNAISFVLAILTGTIISLISEAKKQADLQKDTFIRIISHELKNPFTSAIAYARLIKVKTTEAKNEQLSIYAENISNNIQLANVILDDLIEVSKIESGKFTYHDEVFALEPLVRDIVSDQQVVRGSYVIKVQGSSSKKIQGDKQRIRQVITNLLTNAIKYSPKQNKVTILIRNQGKGVQVAVKDHGIGIPQDQLDKIFNRFFRSSTALESNIKGLGLGLHIADQIIKRHGGELWAKSTLGKGSTFYILLPAQ